MRDYVKEIKILEKEVKEIEEKICQVSFILNNLEIAIYTTRYKTFNGLTLEQAYEKDSELLEAYFRSLEEYKRLKEDLVPLRIERKRKLREKEEMKEEYLRLHTCDFYRPMDMIDICEIIHNNGNIKGVRI